jgi:hypothetical protein
MNGLQVTLRAALGGAVFGGFPGIFAGGLAGGLCGGLAGNVSIGLDAALLGGAVGCLGGAVFGVYLAAREARSEAAAGSAGRVAPAGRAVEPPAAHGVCDPESAGADPGQPLTTFVQPALQSRPNLRELVARRCVEPGVAEDALDRSVTGPSRG